MESHGSLGQLLKEVEREGEGLDIGGGWSGGEGKAWKEGEKGVL